LSGFAPDPLSQHIAGPPWSVQKADSPEPERLAIGQSQIGPKLWRRSFRRRRWPGTEFGKMGGTAPFAKWSLEADDLLSLPDLAAGVLGYYLSKRDVVRPDEIRVKAGADNVLLWLGFLQVGEGDAVQRGAIEFAPINPPPRTLVPIYVQAAIEPR
jgi:hypothetical protein